MFRRQPAFASAVPPLADLTLCDQEPIHTPGHIQPEGALLVIRREDFVVVQASVNLDAILGISAEKSLGVPLHEVLSRPSQEVFGGRARVALEDFVSRDGYAPHDVLQIDGVKGGPANLRAHRTGNLICAEFEPVLPSSHGEASSTTLAQSIISRLGRAKDQQELYNAAASEFKNLTSYDRVMVYQFDDDGHGEVIAEAREDMLPSYLGLHYPATDIPQQARRLFIEQRVRLIGDTRYIPVPIVTHASLHDGIPLDMTHSALRGISPVHLEYLNNMGVTATFGVSLTNSGQLWGMIIGHHCTPRWMDTQHRAAVDLIGQIVSALILGLDLAERDARTIATSKMMRSISDGLRSSSSLADALTASQDDLLDVMQAGGALLRINGDISVMGVAPSLEDATSALSVLYAEAAGDVLATRDLGLRNVDLASCTAKGSGAFLLPLSEATADAILWFRPEVLQTITWGGDPSKPSEPKERLTPRKSFDAWTQIVRGRSHPWRQAEFTLAAELRSLVEASTQGQRQDEARRSAVAEAKYRGLLEAAPDAMVVVNQAGEIVLLNAQTEKQFGYRRDELIGQKVTNIIPEGFAERLVADDLRSPEDALAQQFGTGIELSALRKDGSEFPIEIMLSPLASTEGVLVTAAIRDISVRKKAQDLITARDRAESASRAKSRFLAGMSHELRTPLNGIMGYAQLLNMEGGLNAAQSARVDAMLGAGTHLLEMINSVLDLSQIEAGHLEVQAAEIDPRVIAAACLDLVRPPAEAKKLRLRLVAESDVPQYVMVDPTRLRQVLLNLTGNAVKFTDQGSVELRLRTAADGTRLRVEVADTGRGISPKHRQRLFQDFERLGAEAIGTIEGAGLGLALSAGLVALMGGRIGQEDNPGGGSLFWLELPLMARHSQPVESTQSPLVVTPLSKSLPSKMVSVARSLRILVVDDVAMNRDIASSFLRKSGHDVSCVDDGAQAVEAVTSSDFDVVLMDVRMPVMDGLEATRRIRALAGSAARVPIVALTAQAFVEQVQECRRAGMDSHLAKPFTLATLLAAVLYAAALPRPTGGHAFDSSVSVSVGSELPILDQAAFDLTAAFLSPTAVSTYMQTLLSRSKTLSLALREFPTLRQDLVTEVASAAHTLAGSAGMFGFERLSDIARRFERAVDTGAPDTCALAECLIDVAEASIEKIQHRTTA